MHTHSFSKPRRRGIIGITRGQALLAVLCSMIFFYILTGFVFVSASEPEHQSYRLISVREGDSLWKIASRYQQQAGMEVPRLIDEIKRMNQLDSPIIFPGQELFIPISN